MLLSWPPLHWPPSYVSVFAKPEERPQNFFQAKHSKPRLLQFASQSFGLNCIFAIDFFLSI
jgi:hypothetical protein